ncbi:MAG: hypothetical protein AB7D37_01200 [Desulfovibrio sp.]
MLRTVLRLLLLCLFGLCPALPGTASCMGEKKAGTSLDFTDGRLVLRQSGRALP